jgi:hypothetical protein
MVLALAGLSTISKFLAMRDIEVKNRFSAVAN